METKIESPLDFSVLLETMIKEQDTKVKPSILPLIEKFGKICFDMGFNSGKLPVNNPVFDINSKQYQNMMKK